MEGIKLLIYLLASISATVAEVNCPISDQELSKIGDILTHIDKPIYQEEQNDVSESDECAQLLSTIHTQLRRLTQKYKLMNKGYVKAEVFKKMTEEYDSQLEKLNKELDQFKSKAQGNAKNRLSELKQNIETLEGNVSKLHKELKGVEAEYGEVQKVLCVSYLESNQISNAKNKLKEMDPKYVIEVIREFMKSKSASLLPAIDVSSQIQDLDDRGEAYKMIYSFMESTQKLETEDSVLLETEIQKLNVPGANITDDRRNEIHAVLQNLSIHTEKTFVKWSSDMNQSSNVEVIKNAVDHLFVSQMKVFGEKVGVRKDFDSARNLLKLLALSNNRYKIAAYKSLIEKEVEHAFAVIWLDMLSMKNAELMEDPLVFGLFNETYDLLPDSLKNLSSCKDNVYIYYVEVIKPDKCIVATQQSVEVKYSGSTFVYGHFNEVVAKPTGCTRFKLEPSDDRASARIVSAEGNALTALNFAIPLNPYVGRVGAPYTNSNNASLSISEDWLLEVNRKKGTIKIESEFNRYQTKKSIDHMLTRDIGGVSHVVVARFGSGASKRNEWKFSCAQ